MSVDRAPSLPAQLSQFTIIMVYYACTNRSPPVYSDSAIFAFTVR